MKQVTFNQAEYAEADDWTKIGEFSLANLEAVSGDIAGWPAHWAGFTVSKKNNQEITISPGRYWAEAKTYSNEASFDTNLFPQIPVGATDEKWIAIILRGNERTVTEQRLVDTTPDAETATPVETAVPKTIERYIEIVTQAGTAGPPPQAYPAVSENDCAIAMVRLTVEGVQEIVPVDDDRVKSVYEIEGRLLSVETQLGTIFDRMVSIETDLANLGEAVSDVMSTVTPPEIIRQMQREISRNSNELRNDPDAVAFRYDPGLFADPVGNMMGWAMTHPEADFIVKEGVRFNWASYRDEQLAVSNEDDPNIAIMSGRRMVPAFNEVVRISHSVNDTSRFLNQYASSETEMVQKSISRERVRYGTVKIYCTNRQQFANEVEGLQIGDTFFASANMVSAGNRLQAGYEYQLVQQDGSTDGVRNGKNVFLRQVTRDTYTETYWTAETRTITVSGSTHAQTFLCSQPFTMTAVDLRFATVDNDGAVNIYICEVGPNGTPDRNAVLTVGTIEPADMNTGWCRIPVDPIVLENGERYAIIIVTNGAHQAWTSTDGSFGGGSMFVDTDGAFAQGDLLTDLNFRIIGARYRNVRTTIPFNALTLENGITNIVIGGQTIVPAGTYLEWEIKPQGASQWTVFEEAEIGSHPLAGLPPLTQLRLVMGGTRDLQPLIVLDNTLRGETGRNKGTMVAITQSIDFGLPCTSIVCEYRLDGWIEGQHTFTPTLWISDAEVQPTTVSEMEVLPTEAGLSGERVKVVATFALGAATQTCRVRPKMTAQNVLQVPFIEDVSIHAK